MHRFQGSIDDKIKELEVTEARLVEWQSEGFSPGVEIAKKGIKALKKIIREIQAS
ncbi:hypothetical protein ACQ26C_004393 [Yersinia enterocolitica]